MPRFPLYIPTKGRSQYMITSKALTKMGVQHYLVVEPQQVADYEAAVRAMNLTATVLEMDLTYKDRYELCDGLGLTKSTGPGPARNFAWEHSMANGFAWHWVMDDNIKRFVRLNNCVKIQMVTSTFWDAMEVFCLRYENVAMAGPNYAFVVPQRSGYPPLIFNTRIYSCNLIRNDIPFRWRGRYNEDTILSLDILKAGWCTIQFDAFLQEKMQTQHLSGGNTTEFYLAEGKKREGQRYADTGTIAKSQMLCQVHPDVSRMVWRYSRWHHYVDYRRFRANKLILKTGVIVPTGNDEFGMTLQRVDARAK